MSIVKSFRSVGAAAGRVLDEEDRAAVGRALVIACSFVLVAVICSFTVAAALRIFEVTYGLGR